MNVNQADPLLCKPIVRFQTIGKLNERLEEIKSSLQKKYITRADYEKTI